MKIDQINILQASLLAMQRAILGIKAVFDEVWVDGIHAPMQSSSDNHHKR